MVYIQVFTPFWVNFCVWYKIVVEFHSFALSSSVFWTPFVEETLFLTLYCWLLCGKLINHVYMGFCYVPLIYVSVFMPIPYCFNYCSCIIQFEIRECHAFSFGLLIQDCFEYLRFFCRSIQILGLFVLFLWKMTFGILIEIALNL